MIPGPTPAGSHRRLAAGVQAAVGLGLLLLAFAGCSQASPSGSDSQEPVVTIAPVEGSFASGATLQFHVRAEPAPRADLTVNVTIASSGCELTQAPESVTIAAGESVAALPVPTTGVEAGAEGCEVTATIASGKGYAVAGDGTVDSPRSATTTITTDSETPGNVEPPQEEPRVTVDRLVASVTEGDLLRFELTADPAPDAPLTVNLRWEDDGGYLDGTPPPTATIPTSGTFTVTAATIDDDVDEFNRYVTVTVAGGEGYRVGQPNTAAIIVNNNDTSPRVTVVADARTVEEGDPASFTLTATPAPASALTVNLTWAFDSDRISGTPPSTVTIPTSGTATVTLATAVDPIGWTVDGVL